MRRSVAVCGALLAALGGRAPEAHAQLRPLEPIRWEAFEVERGWTYVGASLFGGHPASLAASEGRLIELGLVGAAVRSGRVTIVLEGSAYRVFDERTAIEGLEPFADPTDDGRRADVGDFRLSTNIRLGSGDDTWTGALRYGVRLPTTNDETGLERDETDFFTTVAIRYRRERVTFTAEGGIGIFGVAAGRFDQTDPLLYSVGATYALGKVTSSVLLLGQYDTREFGPPRGNEHLAEARVGLRGGDRIWVGVDLIVGLADFSPDQGIELRVGRRF